MRVLHLALILGVFIFQAFAGGPYFFVAAPNKIRYQHPEKVLVSVFGANAVDVTIWFEHDGKEFSKQHVHVRDETAPETVEMVVMEADLFGEEILDKPRSIKLKATCNMGTKETDILLSYHTGYLIVQTDKPIYTPQQSVRVRVLPLTEDLHSAKTWPLTMDLKSPNNLTMGRFRSDKNKEKAFFQHSFVLPPKPDIGIWMIKAYYGGQYETEKTLPFEVAKYVLPTYGVTVTVSPRYILPDTPEITVIVKAMYVYQKPVIGSAGLQLSLRSPEGDTRFILSKTRAYLSSDEGTARFVISLADIRGTPTFDFPWFPDQHALSIVADVLEQATGHMEKAHHQMVFSNKQYQFSFARSKKFFRPGFQYYLKLDITYTNGEEVVNKDIQANVLKAGHQEHTLQRATDGDGQALFLFMTNGHDDLAIQVTIGDEVSDIFTVQAYISANQIRVEQKLEDNDEMILQANNNIQLENNVYTGLLFTVWTRGIMTFAKFFPPTADVGEPLEDELQQKLTPSARLTVFYIDTRTDEVVADSTKFRVEKRCRGEMLTLAVGKKQVYPAESDQLTIRGEPSMRVGLNIMDKALLLLNDKNVLRQNSMYTALESHDLGCGEGSGRNSADVFQDSGISVLTNADLTTAQRQHEGCRQGMKRKRRNAKQCGPCCESGVRIAEDVIDAGVDVTTLHCYFAARAIKNNKGARPRCVVELYNTCFKEIVAYLTEMGGWKSNVDEFTDYFEDMDAIGLDSFPDARSDFRESWLFTEVKLPDTGTAVQEIRYPDSITEWMIQAIGVSPDKGICIAAPYNVTAFQEFFIQLDVPYQAVRHEHIDIKATVFRYGLASDPAIEVFVYLEGFKNLCSNTRPGTTSKRRALMLEPNSAQTIRFPVVPLEAGKLLISVKAMSVLNGYTITDGVEKDLYVVNEGIEERVKIQICLDPLGQLNDCQTDRDMVKVQYNAGGRPVQSADVDLTLPAGAISGTGSATGYLTSSNVMDNVVNTLVQGVDALFRLPSGCAEQNIIRLAPTVYAMNYMKQAKRVTEDIEVRGNDAIRKGILHELQYRKIDGSYGVYLHYPSSTWLTAFVNKVFCQVNSTIEGVEVDQQHIIGSLNWVTAKQLHDGSFVDPAPVWHREMIGQLTEGDVTLTAFVLISFLECGSNTEELQDTVSAALAYLESLDPSDCTTYQLAIITYALAKADSARKSEFNDRLKQNALHAGEMTYWDHVGEGRASANAIETTAYALLAQLEFDDTYLSGQIVRWMTVQRDAAGAFRTTQDTVVGLQALSVYNIRKHSSNVDLTVKVFVRDKSTKEYFITKENVQLQNIVKDLPVEYKNNQLNLEITGTGSGIMLVDLRYNRPAKRSELCQFNISEVMVKDLNDNDREIPDFLKSKCDVCGQCGDDEEVNNVDYDVERMVAVAREPMAKIAEADDSKFGRRKRAARNVRATSPKICISFNVSTMGDWSTTGMSIVNVGLETGMQVVKADLETLKTNGVIDEYELPENGKSFIVLYVDEITNVPKTFTFRIKDSLGDDTITRVPAAIRVYDYYNPDSQCTAFYGTGAQQGPSVEFTCDQKQGDQARSCRCVEKTCAQSWVTKLKTEFKRPAIYLAHRTCENTVADYAVIVMVDKASFDPNTKENYAIATVVKALHNGVQSLVTGDEMTFYWKMHCKFPKMDEGKQYYVIAKDGHVSKDENGVAVFRYDLTDTALVMEWKKRCRKRCRLGNIQKVYEGLIGEGCQH